MRTPIVALFALLAAACDTEQEAYTPRPADQSPALGPEDRDLSEPERMLEDARTRDLVPGEVRDDYRVRPVTTTPLGEDELDDTDPNSRIEQRRDAPLIRDPAIEGSQDIENDGGRPAGAWRYDNEPHPATTTSPVTHPPSATQKSSPLVEPDIQRYYPEGEDEQPQPGVWDE